jgi:glutaminase
VICDINQSRFAAPAQSMRDFVRRLCGNPEVVSDSVVARSEYQHRSRNAAAAYLMKSATSTTTSRRCCSAISIIARCA